MTLGNICNSVLTGRPPFAGQSYLSEHSHFILFQSFLSVSYLTEGVEYMLDSKKRGSGLKGEKFGSGGNVSKF